MKNNLALRYLFSTIGMFLVAFGVALSIIANIGTAPLSCPAYVLSLKATGISVGTFTWIINCLYMLVQLAVLRRRFQARMLLQVVASLLFGYLIDGSLALLGWLHPSTLIARAALVMLACFVTALGTSMEVVANAWMLSAELTVKVLCDAFGWKFSTVKIAMDCLCVAVSVVFCLVFFGNPFGSDGIVLGLGTLLLAFFAGWFMKFTTPLVQPHHN